MGKPAVNDLRSGLATAPTLYAAEEFPELLPLIQRRFKEVGGGGAALGCWAEGWQGLRRHAGREGLHEGMAGSKVQLRLATQPAPTHTPPAV